VDVKSYPEFIPYCLSTTILESTSADNRSPNNHVAINPSIENPRSTQNFLAKEDDYRAEEFRVLTRIGYKGFETDYHSHVICQPFESVRVRSFFIKGAGRFCLVVVAILRLTLINHFMTCVQVIAQPSATFTTLTTTWKLSDPPSTATLTPEALKDTTQVQLDLSFKFKNPIHEFLLTDELIWKKFSTLVIQSFQDRLSGLK
jgi:ribosome-associated toxin RatA of RatAB toxin-antitoxin module